MPNYEIEDMLDNCLLKVYGVSNTSRRMRLLHVGYQCYLFTHRRIDFKAK